MNAYISTLSYRHCLTFMTTCSIKKRSVGVHYNGAACMYRATKTLNKAYSRPWVVREFTVQLHVSVGLIMGIRDKKDERIETRLPAEAKQQIELAASMQGRSLSDFVVAAALEQANKVIEQQRIIRLTVDESIALAELLTAEPQANEKSVAAIRHYRETMSS